VPRRALDLGTDRGLAGYSQRVLLLISPSRRGRCSGLKGLPFPAIRDVSDFFRRRGKTGMVRPHRPGPTIVESVNGTVCSRPTRRTPVRTMRPPEGGWCSSINAKSSTAAGSATTRRLRQGGKRRRPGRGRRTAEGANGIVCNKRIRPFPVATKLPPEDGCRSLSNAKSSTAAGPATTKSTEMGRCSGNAGAP
jgi:hypothetical protein